MLTKFFTVILVALKNQADPKRQSVLTVHELLEVSQQEKEHSLCSKPSDSMDKGLISSMQAAKLQSKVQIAEHKG
jgi:hypothetical protein